ncbi:MAG: XRE family transcriptional regulator [Bifidobacteriaceae bacterium]|jgi:transcriptional regulator with XRE-family HTH domain|nr:XRE family transcriptional regulator [Bifidobacteriaceae bacterium]
MTAGTADNGQTRPVGAGGEAHPAPAPSPEALHDELKAAIGAQVRAVRQAQGWTIGAAAERCGISKAMLSKIENAQTSCSLATVAALAEGLEVPVTSLFRGVAVESEAVFVPSGHGAKIIRRGSRQGHLYEVLGSLRGPHKRMEAVLVTLDTSSEVFPMFQHSGTELLYMLEGTMVYAHGEDTYTMRPGDALQFDGEGPHGPVDLVRLPARFLSVTAYPDSMVEE